MKPMNNEAVFFVRQELERRNKEKFATYWKDTEERVRNDREIMNNTTSLPKSYIEKAKEKAKEKIKTNGTIGVISTKGIGGFSAGAGMAESQTAEGKLKSCGIVMFCPSFGVVAEVTGSLQKMVSTSELNSGISASTCVNGTGTLVAGVTGSVCTTNFDSSNMDIKNRKSGIKHLSDYADVGNYTATGGVALGVALGADVSFCPQLTICSAPK